MKRINQVQTLVAMLEGGKLADDMSADVREVVAFLAEQGEGNNRKHKGSVTLKLDFELEGDTMKVVADVTKKTPKISRRASHYFVDAQGDLLTEHPQQRSVFDVDQKLGAVD